MNKQLFISDLCGWRTPCVSDRRFRSPESPATADGGIARGLPVPRGLNSQRGSGPAVERRRRSRPRSTGFHGSSPRKCQRLSTLRWVRLPPSRPPHPRAGPAQAAADPATVTLDRLSPRPKPHLNLSPCTAWAYPESCTHLCDEPVFLTGAKPTASCSSV